MPNIYSSALSQAPCPSDVMVNGPGSGSTNRVFQRIRALARITRAASAPLAVFRRDRVRGQMYSQCGLHQQKKTLGQSSWRCPLPHGTLLLYSLHPVHHKFRCNGRYHLRRRCVVLTICQLHITFCACPAVVLRLFLISAFVHIHNLKCIG